MGAIRTQSHDDTKSLGSTSEQGPKCQHTFFDIVYHRFTVNCKNSPVFREHLLNAV